MGIRKYWGCKVEGCYRKHYGNGYCKLHNHRLWKNGTLEPQKIIRDPLKLFHSSYIPVTETGCWIWEKSIARKGYGIMWVQNEKNGAHRYSWELYHGPIPKGMFVLHKCDVPSCVNPDHLFLGTHQDNMDDMRSKGRERYVKGEACHSAKLKESDVVQIRKLKKEGVSSIRLSELFNVIVDSINNICSYRTWKHVN